MYQRLWTFSQSRLFSGRVGTCLTLDAALVTGALAVLAFGVVGVIDQGVTVRAIVRITVAFLRGEGVGRVRKTNVDCMVDLVGHRLRVSIGQEQ